MSTITKQPLGAPHNATPRLDAVLARLGEEISDDTARSRADEPPAPSPALSPEDKGRRGAVHA